MKKLTLAVGTAVIGLSLVAGSVRSARAAQTPSDNTSCAYHLWHCSYAGPDYWSNCEPDWASGWVSTKFAKGICEYYHPE